MRGGGEDRRKPRQQDEWSDGMEGRVQGVRMAMGDSVMGGN